VIARRFARFAVAFAGACGGHDAAVLDAAPDTAPAPACTAVFRDNFAETWTGPVDCATVDTADGHTTLAFAIPSRTIAAEFAIAIDLGAAPPAGIYTAESLVTPWSAHARQDFDMTACVYHAGTAAVPPGTFTLALDAAGEHPHGRLDLQLAVLSRPYTYCGETHTERLTVVF